MADLSKLVQMLQELKTVSVEDLKEIKFVGIAGARSIRHPLAKSISSELDAVIIDNRGGVDYAAFDDLKHRCPDLELQVQPLEQDSFGWLRGGLFMTLHNRRFLIAFG